MMVQVPVASWLSRLFDHVEQEGVPVGVMVLGPQQFKQRQEMGAQNEGRKLLAPDAMPPEPQEKPN
jgi:hypothetical protein